MVTADASEVCLPTVAEIHEACLIAERGGKCGIADMGMFSFTRTKNRFHRGRKKASNGFNLLRKKGISRVFCAWVEVRDFDRPTESEIAAMNAAFAKIRSAER